MAQKKHALHEFEQALGKALTRKPGKIREFGQRLVDLTEEVREHFCTNSDSDIQAVIATHDEFAKILRDAAYDYGRDTSRWEWQDEIDQMQRVEKKKAKSAAAKKPERRISLAALGHAIHNAPAAIGDIAKRETHRQTSSFGLDKNESPEVAQLRAWLRANPHTSEKAKSAASGK